MIVHVATRFASFPCTQRFESFREPAGGARGSAIHTYPLPTCWSALRAIPTYPLPMGGTIPTRRYTRILERGQGGLVTISVGITYIAWHVHCITCQHMRTGGICIPTRRVPRRSPVPTVWVGGCACAWFWSCASAARLRARVRRPEGGALACAWRAASGGCLARVPPALPDLAVRLCLLTSAWRLARDPSTTVHGGRPRCLAALRFSTSPCGLRAGGDNVTGPTSFRARAKNG